MNAYTHVLARPDGHAAKARVRERSGAEAHIVGREGEQALAGRVSWASTGRALAAVEEPATDYQRAARRLAEQRLDAGVVLPALREAAGVAA